MLGPSCATVSPGKTLCSAADTGALCSVAATGTSCASLSGALVAMSSFAIMLSGQCSML